MERIDDENITRIYKYYPLTSPEQFKHIESLLLNGEIYFSKPTEFNDPFDSLVDFDFSKVKEKDIERFLSETGDEKALLAEYGDNFLDGMHSYAEIFSFLEQKTKQIRTKVAGITFRIACFSEKRDNILMWSHYASSHRGICIGFETTIINGHLGLSTVDFPCVSKSFMRLKPMKYSDTRPMPYNMFNGSATKAMLDFLFAKHILWEYEKERRAIITASIFPTTGIVHVETSIIKEIIFGICIDQNNKQFLMKKAPASAEMFQAILPDNSYQLHLKKI